MNNYHIPVLLKETLDFLKIKKDKWYIDCNLGGGGHTEEILKRDGRVLGIDLDADSIKEVAKIYSLKITQVDDHLQAVSDNLILVQSNFSELEKVINNHLIEPTGLRARRPELVSGSIGGILFDLGVSSFQIESANRGFSFNKDAPLDMRMNQNSNFPTAADLINGLHEGELADLFFKLGEENFAKRIAKKIVEKRSIKKIETTSELAQVILSVKPRNSKDKIHPATKVFQALRIAVNDEVNSLKDTLPQALEVLSPGGKIVVISFHSLEDRIVKNQFKSWEENMLVKILTDKPLNPTDYEVDINPRSRSAKLRAIVKL